MHIRRVVTVCILALVSAGAFAGPVRAQDVVPPTAKPMTATARVDQVVRTCLEDGTHWDRCRPLVDLGTDAVAPLIAILADAQRPLGQRVLAAQALGRLRAPAAMPTLRSVATAQGAATQGATPALVDVAAAGLFLLGETSLVDARIELLLTRYSGISIARETALTRVADTYAQTGRFASAARVMRNLVEDVEDADRKRALAYNWACYECLAGHRSAALEAAALAVEFSQVDLAWMARDGDLGLIREDPAFVALLARVPDGKAAAVETIEKSPAEVEFAAFSRSYWDGAFELYLDASNAYWEGYTDWLEAGGRERSEEAAAEWLEAHGPSPEDPTAIWVPRFEAWLVRSKDTPLAAQIRDELLIILGNADQAAAWVDLFLASAAKTPERESVGGNADTALYWSERIERQDEVLAVLRNLLKSHPSEPSGAGIRIALAQQLRHAGDVQAARSLYADVVRLYPGSFRAEEATGALYEMERLVKGGQAPGFQAQDLRGAPLSLDSLRGRIVVLDFWATWCGPCLGELPNIKKLHAEFGPRADFALIGVSLDSDGIALVDFLAEESMSWPQICTLAGFEEPLARLFNVRGIPDTFLLDREGNILERGLRGEKLHAAVKKALASN